MLCRVLTISSLTDSHRKEHHLFLSAVLKETQSILPVRKSIRPVIEWVMRCRRGYLAGVRCKWFTYSLHDATATASSLASLKSRKVILCGVFSIDKPSLPEMPQTRTLFNLSFPGEAAKWPCGVCGRGVGSNSIQCTSCQKWVHKKCSDIKGSMYKVTKSFTCRGCSL